MAWQGEPSQDIVVAGGAWSGPLTTWRTVWTTTPAGAPPGCPALPSQSRNWFKMSSSVDAQLVEQ